MRLAIGVDMFNDLREFIAKAKELGELKLVEGADRDLEIGAITEWLASLPNPPALLFDHIPGFEAGCRVASNLFDTMTRTALVLGLSPQGSPKELIIEWREKIKQGLQLIPPVKVGEGPVLENVHLADQVDLLAFPAPKWHEEDGGRYIGTGDAVIVRDPEEGWVNLGAYRAQVHDRSTLTINIELGKHAELIAKKYWKNGRDCPIAISCGQEPAVSIAAGTRLSWGMSEYSYAGWLKGKPVEVIEGVTTRLPIPATAEIVLEGELLSPEKELRPEGPFGEWTGHYGRGRFQGKNLVIKVKAILHRHQPIIQGAPPLLDRKSQLASIIRKSAELWNELDRNIKGVMGVWFPTEAGGSPVAVVSLKQQYPGHAKQAAMLMGGLNPYVLKYLIVVDEDVDPTNTKEVLWAMGMRSDPETSIDIIRKCWDSGVDPAIPPQKRIQGDFTHSMAIIDACKPFEWINEFPKTVKTTPELMARIKQKWEKIL